MAEKENKQTEQPENPPEADPFEVLDKRKEDLFARLKESTTRHKAKIQELRIIRAQVEDKVKETGVNARELRRRKERLEFRIATEATNLQKERDMMKEMRVIDKQLEKAGEVEKIEARLRAVEGELRAAESEIVQTKRGIDEVKGEMRNLRDSQREKRSEEREKQWQERKRHQLMEREKEMRKEAEQYMGGLDEGVDLGSIAIIKKKGQ